MKNKGVVIKGVGGFYTVLAEDGPLLNCRQRGKLRKKDGGLYPGDKVAYSLLAQKGEGDVDAMIEEVLPRSNHLLRPKSANLDLALVVFAAKEPEPDFLLLDRILIMCRFHQIKPLICFNKCDLLEEAEASALNRQASVYRNYNFPVFLTSSLTGQGLAEIIPYFKHKVTVLAGPSGSGKSSLLNSLFPSLNLLVGDISQRLHRGKHTTRHTEMLALDNQSLIADTPGFSLLDLPKELEYRELPGLYPEFEGLSPCRFDGCLHYKEPGCSAKEALEHKLLDEGRYQRYIRLLLELKEREERY